MMISSENVIFRLLTVKSENVSFSFECEITDLNQKHIMINSLTITDQDSIISIYQRCYSSLLNNYFSVEVLANFRWIESVSMKLWDLTWVKKALIIRSHLFGRIFRLKKRKNKESAYSSLKDHVVLISQNTIRLLDILSVSSDALTDIAHVI